MNRGAQHRHSELLRYLLFFCPKKKPGHLSPKTFTGSFYRAVIKLKWMMPSKEVIQPQQNILLNISSLCVFLALFKFLIPIFKILMMNRELYLFLHQSFNKFMLSHFRRSEISNQIFKTPCFH